MKELIRQINESPTFARILEVGAGVPIANEMFSYAGASRTVYSSESYYSRDAFAKVFGESKHRAVSAEKLKDINEHPSIVEDLKNGLYNTVLSTTFQVGDETNSMSTHGWICINVEGTCIRYYHISLHNPNSRLGHIKNIGEIGILLLHANNSSIPNDCCVDIVLDENLKPLHKETLDFLSHSTGDMMAVFTTKGIDRIESITRDVDALIVYKGSFNPPSLSHKEIIETSIDLYEGNKKAVFCLSYNTFQKGIQSVESFLERVELLNKLGYDVIISSKPLFKNTYDFIRLKYAGLIVFPQGVDTINRMADDYIHSIGQEKIKNFFDLNSFKKDFKNTEFLIFQRDNEEIKSLVQENLVDSNLVRIIDSEYTSISSTNIRNLVNQGEFDKVKELVPTEIYNEVIKKRF
jgi:nicotinic acid mononucleotide adenylyltransferase